MDIPHFPCCGFFFAFNQTLGMDLKPADLEVGVVAQNGDFAILTDDQVEADSQTGLSDGS